MHLNGSTKISFIDGIHRHGWELGLGLRFGHQHRGARNQRRPALATSVVRRAQAATSSFAASHYLCTSGTFVDIKKFLLSSCSFVLWVSLIVTLESYFPSFFLLCCVSVSLDSGLGFRAGCNGSAPRGIWCRELFCYDATPRKMRRKSM